MAEPEPTIGSCHECILKNKDYTEKPVSKCKFCGNNFCHEHQQPKFPYFVDWDNLFDIQGNPEIKALYYSEFNRKDGHPDFVFWKKTFERLDLEEEIRNKLIKQAMDKMMDSEPVKPYTVIQPDFEEIRKLKEDFDIHNRATEEAITIHNKYGHRFRVPSIVYSDIEYRVRLDNARTLAEVEEIIALYRQKKTFSLQPAEYHTTMEEETPKPKEMTKPSVTVSSKNLNKKIGLSIALISILIVCSVGVVYYANLPPNNPNPFSPISQTPAPANTDWSWASYNYTLEPNSQYTIVLTAKEGYTFESWRYVTSTRWSSTEMTDIDSNLTVSGEIMDINV